MFQQVCKLDLEGIVAKEKEKVAPHISSREETTWAKILNPNYSQRDGREELFERERQKNLSLAGTVVNWLAQRWNNELSIEFANDDAGMPCGRPAVAASGAKRIDTGLILKALGERQRKWA